MQTLKIMVKRLASELVSRCCLFAAVILDISSFKVINDTVIVHPP